MSLGSDPAPLLATPGALSDEPDQSEQQPLSFFDSTQHMVGGPQSIVIGL